MWLPCNHSRTTGEENMLYIVAVDAMESFIIKSQKVNDRQHIQFRNAGVSKKRVAMTDQIELTPLRPQIPESAGAGVASKEDANAMPVTLPALPAVPVPEGLHAPRFRACRSVDTRRWMHDASNCLIDALLCKQMPKETALMWAGVVAQDDIHALLDRQTQRQLLASQALQTSIEMSLPERAVELAKERDRCLAETQAAAEHLDAAADRCVDSIDAAIHAAEGLRTKVRNSRRDVKAMHTSLSRLCAPAAYRSWAPRIRAILNEEAESAYASLDALSEMGIVSIRAYKSSTMTNPTTQQHIKKPGLVTNSHLQSMLDAIDLKSKLRCVQKMQAVAYRAQNLFS